MQIPQPYLDLIESIRGAIYRCQYDGTPVVIALPPYVATLVCDAIEEYCKRLFGEAILNPVAQVADEMMRDQHTRFALAVADLEILLTHFIGRPEATMEQVRQHRLQAEMTRYQTIPRPRTNMTVSEELRRSIMSGRIGDPREPGSDG